MSQYKVHKYFTPFTSQSAITRKKKDYDRKYFNRASINGVLNMSVVNGLYYQQLSETVNAHAIGSTDTFYFTIPWHGSSVINQINVWNTTSTNMTVDAVNILNNSAHFRFNNSTLEHIVYTDDTDKTGKAKTNYFVSYSVNNDGAYVNNLYGRPFLNVLVYTTNAVSNPHMYCQVIGKKALPDNIINSDSTSIEKDKTYRVLMVKDQVGLGGTDKFIYDITSAVTGKGGENASRAGFASTFDYLYVGSSKQLDHWEFNLSSVGATNASLTVQYWNGTTWSSTGMTILDETSCIGNDSLRYSGIIENKGLPAMSTLWTKTRLTGTGLSLPLDPVTYMKNQIVAGNLPPMTIVSDPERYWVRFKVDKLVGTGISFSSILPIVERY
jgi:hypothetical protein